MNPAHAESERNIKNAAENQKENEMEISKSDWKLYREKLPIWQEKYMERLTAEYIELLNSDKSASDKFWELEERIYADKKKPD